MKKRKYIKIRNSKDNLITNKFNRAKMSHNVQANLSPNARRKKDSVLFLKKKKNNYRDGTIKAISNKMR